MKKIIFLTILVAIAVVGYKVLHYEAIEESVVKVEAPLPVEEKSIPEKKLKEVNHVWRFFTQGSDRFPFIETVTYSSRVPWFKGRPAWISDYASHYSTSRHFIARSLNKKRDYETQKVIHGDRFNVFSKDKRIQFLLRVDLFTKIMSFYYIDLDEGAEELIRTYRVGVGRPDPTSPSFSLTPTGKYSLGDKVAIYREGVTGFFNNQEEEMIRVFGTRWLPLGEEISHCSHGAKGYGIHGLPCYYDDENKVLVEEKEHLGQCTSDGCIRMQKEDIEELFAVIITKPVEIEIVNSENRGDVE